MKDEEEEESSGEARGGMQKFSPHRRLPFFADVQPLLIAARGHHLHLVFLIDEGRKALHDVNAELLRLLFGLHRLQRYRKEVTFVSTERRKRERERAREGEHERREREREREKEGGRGIT